MNSSIKTHYLHILLIKNMEHHYTLCYNEYEGNDNVISDQWYISIYHVC